MILLEQVELTWSVVNTCLIVQMSIYSKYNKAQYAFLIFYYNFLVWLCNN